MPEVIEHGRSGIIVDDYRQMAEALEQADALDPLELPALRGGAILAPERMVDDYVRAYRAAVAA